MPLLHIHSLVLQPLPHFLNSKALLQLFTMLRELVSSDHFHNDIFIHWALFCTNLSYCSSFVMLRTDLLPDSVNLWKRDKQCKEIPPNPT